MPSPAIHRWLLAIGLCCFALGLAFSSSSTEAATPPKARVVVVKHHAQPIAAIGVATMRGWTD